MITSWIWSTTSGGTSSIPWALARVGVDVREQLLLVLAACDPLAAQHHIAAPELLHRAHPDAAIEPARGTIGACAGS